MNRDWFIMAASTVSFYTNEEAYNKTNIQESFQKLSFSNKNGCFCLKIAVFVGNLSFMPYSAGESAWDWAGERFCKQQFAFFGSFFLSQNFHGFLKFIEKLKNSKFYSAYKQRIHFSIKFFEI